MVTLVGNIPLQNYICWAQENWTQVGAQAAEGDRKIEQDWFDENLNNFIKCVSIYNDNDE